MATIITKNSATPSQVPSSLTQGELAINVTDGKLYYGSGSGNVVKEFTGTGGSTDTGSLLTTASVSLNTITFTKGDGTTFPITVNTGSGGGGSTFPYTGSAIVSGSLTVTGSFYVSNSIDSVNKQLIDDGGIASVRWNNYRLYNSSNNLVVHWGTGDLYSGSFITSSVSWTNRVLRDSDGTVTIDWENGLFNDTTGNSSLDANNRLAYDPSTVVSSDWGTRQLFDDSGLLSSDWRRRNLNDSTEILSIDWENRQLKDASDLASMNYRTRQLFASDGSTAALDYNTPESLTVTGHLIPGGTITDNTSSYDLGSATAAWRDLYVSNGSINLISGSQSASISFTNGALDFGTTPIISPDVIATASVSSNTITFTKGDGSTFPITVDTGSGLSINSKITNFIQSVDGATVTLTTSNTLSSTLLIPANTVSVGDSISIKVRAAKTGTVSTSRVFVYVNTLPSLSGATLLASGPSAAGLQIFQQMSRELIVKSLTDTQSFPTGTALITDDNTTSVAVASTNIDWTTNQYFIFSLILGNANDAIKTTYSRVTVLKV